jgi:hypothetical protein
MAKMACKCGTVLRDDDPDKSLLLLSRREFDVERTSETLFGRAIDVLQCGTCGRLWVFWDEAAEAVEYVRAPDDL